MSKRVTSFDVARLAGVSQATVSRALRDLPNITPETRERVARAAEQLPRDTRPVLALAYADAILIPGSAL